MSEAKRSSLEALARREGDQRWQVRRSPVSKRRTVGGGEGVTRLAGVNEKATDPHGDVEGCSGVRNTGNVTES